MKEYIISTDQEGQKFFKFCMKVLPNAGSAFVHKMIRKKNITLNGKKADENITIKKGDKVNFFFSDETFEKFSGITNAGNTVSEKPLFFAKTALNPKRILFENEHVLFYNKPVNMLSQKAKDSDISLNELFLQYLVNQKVLDAGKYHTVKPSICNRLDRNTSGLVILGKSQIGLSTMNQMLKDRTLTKRYHCVVNHVLKKEIHHKAYLLKDKANNQVQIFDTPKEGAAQIETLITPIKNNRSFTLCEVDLITGKSHQIRAHLSYLGYPLVGDTKYGIKKVNDRVKAEFGIQHQLLHANTVTFPDIEGALCDLSNKTFLAPKPKEFENFLIAEDL